MRVFASLLAFTFAFCLSIGSTAAQGADGVAGGSAQSFSLGGGCGAPAPTLNTNLPVLGSAFVIAGTATQGAFGQLFLSLPIGGIPVNIGGPTFTDPCLLFIQTNAFVVLDAFFVSAAGTWGSGGTITTDPAAAGAAFNLQAGFVTTATGITASNGQRIVLGL